jgi:hypothetical protein
VLWPAVHHWPLTKTARTPSAARPRRAELPAPRKRLAIVAKCWRAETKSASAALDSRLRKRTALTALAAAHHRPHSGTRHLAALTLAAKGRRTKPASASASLLESLAAQRSTLTQTAPHRTQPVTRVGG